MDDKLKKEWVDFIAEMICSIGKQIRMEEKDQILMLKYLNTPNKINKFVEWAKTKTVNDKIQSTPMKVLSAATRIGRGMEPLD